MTLILRNEYVMLANVTATLIATRHNLEVLCAAENATPEARDGYERMLEAVKDALYWSEKTQPHVEPLTHDPEAETWRAMRPADWEYKGEAF